MKQLLKNLTEFSAPSGFENSVVSYLYKRLENIVDECYVDGIGNLIVKCNGSKNGPTLMLSAHTDEVGFIVKKIESNGLIRFEKIGGHDDRVLLAQKVVISTEKGLCYGVIGTISCHMAKFEEPKFVRKHSDLYIDVGISNKEEAIELGIKVGDPITYYTEFQEFGKNRVIGKAFDDRAGCAVIVKALEEIDFSKVNGVVYASFSCQEEVGLRGARVASQQIDADIAIAIDTTPCSDTFEPMMDNSILLGKGPAIRVMDFSVLCSVAVRKKLENLAKKMSMPYQLEVFLGIGTDAGELHKEKGGVPTGVISIPSRYTHSPVEIIDLNDLEASKDLLKEFILSMESKEEFNFLK